MSETVLSIDDIIKNVKTAVKSAKLECSVITLTENTSEMDVEVIPLPSSRFNAATGIGGLPRGRIIEVLGSESSGKTTFCLHAIAEAQKMGLATAFIDMEHALDKTYAANLNIDLSKLMIAQPDTGDDALVLAQLMVQNGVALIIVDSVAALVSRDELSKNITDSNIGLQARMMSQGLRQLAPTVGKNKACLIFTNQIREKVGVMFGNPETTTGGRALKFYASMRIRLSGKQTGNAEDLKTTTKIKIIKNKLASPHRECEVDIVYGKGFDAIKDALEFGKDIGVVKQSGPYYTLPDLGVKCSTEPSSEGFKFRGSTDAVNFLETESKYFESLKILLSKKQS